MTSRIALFALCAALALPACKKTPAAMSDGGTDAGAGGGGGGGGGGGAGSGGGDMSGGGTVDMTTLPPDMTQLTLTVDGATNLLQLDTCMVTPATIPNLAAGSYTISLDASTLSKGTVATTPPQPSIDNYVLVQLPLPANDAQEAKRFFMLNGIGASAAFMLPATGTVNVMFIDSDDTSNSGQATVSTTPGGASTTVDAVTNVLRWRQACNSTAAQLALPLGMHVVKLTASTLKLPDGSAADYVIVRLPSELPQDDHRYITLNGVGASYTFNANDSTPLHAWFISPATGSTGQATLVFDP